MFKFDIGDTVYISISKKLEKAIIRDRKHTLIEMFGETLLDKNYYKLETDVYDFLLMRGENEVYINY